MGAEYTDDPEVLENTINDIKKRNRTLGGIFIWGTAIIKYWELEKEIGPIREDIEKLNEEVKGLREQYDELNSTYLKTLNETKALMHKNQELTKKIKKFEDEIRINSERKKNAKDLIRLLKDEGIRWKETLSMIDHEIENFLGNIFLSSAIISYLSPFTGMYRKDQVKDWIKLCNRHKIKVSQDYSLETTISDQVEIRSWNINGLPSDSVSKENAIMMFNNPKFILLIDPQVQGNYWLKKMFKQDHKNDKNDDSIRIYKGDKTEKHGEKVDKNDDMALKLTVDIQRGSHVLIENVGIKLDTLFNPLIMRLQFEDNGASYIEFNSIQIEYNNNFRIFFTTKLSNPHYSPEMFINLNIINFTVTFQGLTEQLLSEVFKLEKREKYEQRDKLIEEMGECNAEIKNLEKIILERLAEAKQETILDDNELIETLERSKVTSEDINVKVKINKVIEDEINKLRNDYIPVATRGSILYFVIVDISNIDPMYQFSLEFFKKLFNMSIQKKRKGIINTVSQRVDLLEKKITKDIFRNIKRGIFENHKTIFSFLIAIYIKKTANVIKDEDWNFFLKGPPTFDKTELLSNPDDRYFTDHSWDSILYFQNLYQYADFSENITKNLEYYKKFFNDIVNLNQFEEFVKTTKYPLPNNFFKLLMIKMFRPEKLLLFVKYFIIAELGKIFTDNTPPKLDEVFAESDYKTPIIFILSQGADPADNLIKFKDRCNLPYEEKKEEETVMTLRKPNSILISLGQGQNHIAEDAIDNSVKNGDWVILQNCHLFKSWMTILGEKVQKIQEDDYPDPIHPHFRLWLTSMPNEFFPISVLQNGLKITTEPPSGVKANVKNLFDCYTANLSNKDDVLLKSKIKDKFPRLAISLSFFHAVMQERKKFGPIGFNLRYDFNLTDYDTSYTMMLTYVDENEDDVPWKSITYLVGDVNYGGRVTDDWDRRTMKTTLKKFLTEKLFDERYKFTPDGVYFCPNFTSLNNYMDYVESLPLFDDPEFFGLHSNANIIFQLQESNNLVNTLLKIIPKTKSSGKSPHEIILETIKFFAENKPDLIERKERAKVHEKIYENGLNHSLSIVMYHEVEKFNKLLTKIQSSLENLEDAIKGTITMSNEGEEIFNSLHLNKIPLTWSKICYPSHKPLASWFKDLLERVNFIRTWLTQGHPHVFWLPGLFFPQGFITGVLQTHARDFKKPVSEISFKYKILQKSVEEIFKAPAVIYYF